VDQSLSA